MIPRAGSSGVEKTLVMRISPSAVVTQSVKVPPVSTPIRIGDWWVETRLGISGSEGQQQ